MSKLHSCTLTATTYDARPLPPCEACQEAFEKRFPTTHLAIMLGIGSWLNQIEEPDQGKK